MVFTSLMTSEAILSIGGIYLFYLGCKNLVKLYKQRSLIIKILMCGGLFLVSLIIGILFMFLINPNISPYFAGQFSFVFMGLFAEMISLGFKFNYYQEIVYE